MTPARRDPLSLFDIEAALQDLLVAREEVTDPAEAEQVEKALAEYVTRELSKVDSIRGLLKNCRLVAEAARQEAADQEARARRVEALAERVKGYCATAMNAAGKRKLEGRTGTISLRGNGGIQPLHVDGWNSDTREWGESATANLTLSSEFVDRQIWMRDTLWGALTDEQKALCRPIRVEPSNARIREALAAPCLACSGMGYLEQQTNIETQRVGCPDCDGDGRRRVPGARLLDRGEHVEVR